MVRDLGSTARCPIGLLMPCRRDIMEPVTYLSGLSMVILGYLWWVPARTPFGSVDGVDKLSAQVPLSGS